MIPTSARIRSTGERRFPYNAPDHKMSGAFVMADASVASVASVAVNIWFPSIIGQTHGSIDPTDFYVAYCGWVEEGSFRWSAAPLIQDGRYGRHLGFGFRRIQDNRLGWLISFLCGSLGMSRGRYLSVISSAIHPRWPPTWILFPSIRGQTPGSIDPIFLWLIGND
jgi:hypothetical protein